MRIPKVTKNPDGIVINRMFTGNYLLNNLGHEIINLFKADNGCCYLYLNPSGKLTKENAGIKTMLMVQYVGEHTVEVIAKATGLEIMPGVLDRTVGNYMEPDSIIRKKQKDYILENNICYGGVSIIDIFDQSEQQNVYITYRAGEVRFPKKDHRIFIHYGKDRLEITKKSKVVNLEDRNFPSQSLRNFILSTEKNNKKADDYMLLMEEIVDNNELWDSEEPGKIPPAKEICRCNNGMSLRRLNLFDICGIQNRENCFTNALGFFMQQWNYKKLWQDFFKNLQINLSVDFNVRVEVGFNFEGITGKNVGGRIDMLIEDNDNIIVIENKIKSDINTSTKDMGGTNQLERYIDYVERKDPERRKKHTYFLLSPEYNKPELTGRAKENYVPMSYLQIYKFLDSIPWKSMVDTDENFQILRDAMYRHTLQSTSVYLRMEMQEKFYNRICNNKNKN